MGVIIVVLKQAEICIHYMKPCLIKLSSDDKRASHYNETPI